MWKQKYMLKNLLFFLVPLMIPILILGSFAILITQHFIKDDVNQKNMNLLLQTRDHLELILNEMDTLALSYQTNHNIAVRLKSVLSAEKLEYEQILELNLLTNFLSSPANARPYIHSIYVYYQNPGQRFLTSSVGLTSLEQFYDVDWFESYPSADQSDIWIEKRTINPYDIDEIQIITMYRKLYTPGAKQANGILVLNILPSYVESALQELTLSPEQIIVITDRDGHILLQTNQVPDIALPEWVSKGSNANLEDVRSHSYHISNLPSERYELEYISLIPEKVLYRVPELVKDVTFYLLLICFVIGISITYVLTKRNFNNLKTIESIISAAKQGKPYPRELSKVTDEYGFILQKIIRSFVEKNYLETQLSERNYALKYMEMLALQSQINPHFLYNTLEVIYWKTFGLTGKPNDASQLVEHLSDILKYALSDPKHTVLLEKEIEYTQIYLEIQKVRNKDKLHVLWEVDDAARYYEIPKLILQPIIENSIYHGVKEKEGKSTIKIKIELRQTNIRIRIIDNGKGMTKSRLITVRDHLSNQQNEHRSTHIGLYNTNKRITLIYGQAHQLRILSKYNWGTLVEMSLPINEKNNV